ncbi:hypothetical protein [Flavobacterium oreochromis]|uniref:hypothetical protein n=1 Tax=Flavobacterium oreochromis TaxID=2906078 RepID=UPI00385F7ED0
MKNKPFEVVIIILIIILFSFKDSIFDSYIKNTNRYGISFINSERDKHNFNNWKLDSKTNENFKIAWINQNTKDKHKRIVIDYGYFGPKTETNIFINLKHKTRIYYSVYNFKTNLINYYYDENINGKNITFSMPEYVIEKMLNE